MAKVILDCSKISYVVSLIINGITKNFYFTYFNQTKNKAYYLAKKYNTTVKKII